MRRIAFTEAEILQLKKERIEDQHPIVRPRMMALYMKAVGYRHKEICCGLNISHVCLYEYLDLYLKQGFDGLRHLGYKGKRNLLDENRDIIIAHLKTHPPGTLKEAQARIEEITGIMRSLPQIRAFLKETPFAKESETSFTKGQHRCTGAFPRRNTGVLGG